MKKALKISGIVVLSLIILMIVLPYAFKGKIIKTLKEEINTSINADVDFKGVGLSFFSSFPDLTLTLKDLSVIGREDFALDTMARIEALKITVNIWNIIASDSYRIEKIAIERPDIYLKVMQNGKANWDITLPSDSSGIESQDTSSLGFELSLKKLLITDGKLIYDDQSLKIFVHAKNLNHTLKGDFSSDFSALYTETTIDELSVDYENISYLSKVKTKAIADIDADLRNFNFTFKQNELFLNELLVKFEGNFGILPNDDYSMNINFKTPSDDFRSFLSVFPAIYHKDFEDLKARGKMSLNGKVNGIYNDNVYPGFNINLYVDNASFKYESLPKPVEKISLDANISNVGGSPDNTVIDLRKFHFEMAGNPVDIRLLMKTPITDPYIETTIKGKIYLEGIKDFYPLDDRTAISGMVISDLFLKGNQSSIDGKKFDEFEASGSLEINKFNYASPDFSFGNIHSDMLLSFNPAFIQISGLFLKVGKTIVNANGKIGNYLPFFLSNGILSGQVNLKSEMIDLNEFMPKTDPNQVGTSDSSALAAIQIPANIDFSMNSEISRLIYDDIEMSSVKGIIMIKDQELILSNLVMNLLDGSMKINGAYDSRDIQKPKVNFNFNLIDVNIQKAASTIEMINQFAPVLHKVSGKMSIGMTMTTDLDNDMMPIYKTVNGNGILNTSKVTVKNLSTLYKLSDALKLKEFKELDLNPVKLSFEIAEGLIGVKPFNINFKDITSSAGGTAGLDQSLNFFMDMNVPRAYFGTSANSVLDNLVSEAAKTGVSVKIGSTVPVSAIITGTMDDPKVKVSLKNATGSLTDDLKKQALEEFNNAKKLADEKLNEEIQKQKAFTKAEADKILADAGKQAENLINEAQIKAQEMEKAAVDASKKAKTEADKQAQSLINEGKKNGFIAEAAAKKSAEKFKAEAYKNADKMVDESKKQGQSLINEARKKAEIILEEANKKVESINQIPVKK